MRVVLRSWGTHPRRKLILFIAVAWLGAGDRPAAAAAEGGQPLRVSRRGFDPSTLQGRRGELLRIEVSAADDAEHCFALDALRIEKRVVTGRPTRVDLVPGRRVLVCARGPGQALLEAAAPGYYRHLRLRGGDEAELLPLFTSLPPGVSPVLSLTGRDGARLPLGAHAVLAEYDPGVLPLRVRSWLPLVVEIAPAASAAIGGRTAWLETARQPAPGYRARVDGVEAAPEVSPAGSVSVPVREGATRVELRHEPPPLLRALFPLSAATWVALGLGLLRARRQARAADRIE